LYRTMTIAVAAAAMGLAAWSSSASAQVGVEIYTEPPAAYEPDYRRPGYYGYRAPGYANRTPGYASSRPYSAPGVEVDVDYPHGRGGCGTYRFWNGRECVDARYR
jgi:hypothetical protein